MNAVQEVKSSGIAYNDIGNDKSEKRWLRKRRNQ